MITIVGAWEKDWLDPKVELFMWRQLCAAFGVDRLVMTPALLSERTSVCQFGTVEDALADCEGELVIMEPNSGEPLDGFEHPDSAVYLFGNAWAGNARRDGRKVTIKTAKPVDMFAVDAAAITLFHRGLACR